MAGHYQLSIDGATDEEAAAISAAIETMLAAEGTAETDVQAPSGSRWRFAARLDGVGESIPRPTRVPADRRWRTVNRQAGGW